MGGSKAVFWVATKSHFHEVKQSAQSVAAQMPELPRYLLTPDTDHFDGIDFVVRMPGCSHSKWYLDFVAWMGLAFDNIEADYLLYLDTDTYMAHPVPEVFNLLDHFDLASVIAPARQISYTVGYIPACFAEFNTGVLAFRNCDQVRELFAEWLRVYEDNPDLYGENDQGPLREVLLDWPGRFWAMSPEYNCRFGFGGQAAGLIKILHGRSDDMAGLAQRINADTGIRGWRRGDFS